MRGGKGRKVITEECTRGLQEIIYGQNEIEGGSDWERRDKKNENIWKEKKVVWREVRKRN
jgi:hypothetical protein